MHLRVNLIPRMLHKVPFQLFGTWFNDLYPFYPQTLYNNYYISSMAKIGCADSKA